MACQSMVKWRLVRHDYHHRRDVDTAAIFNTTESVVTQYSDF